MLVAGKQSDNHVVRSTLVFILSVESVLYNAHNDNANLVYSKYHGFRF